MTPHSLPLHHPIIRYLSLNHTLASVNNAIYQSAAAVVFLLSWVRGAPCVRVRWAAVTNLPFPAPASSLRRPFSAGQAWQGEPATMKKLVAVALAIGGVAIVILAPTSAEQNSPVQQVREGEGTRPCSR